MDNCEKCLEASISTCGYPRNCKTYICVALEYCRERILATVVKYTASIYICQY